MGRRAPVQNVLERVFTEMEKTVLSPLICSLCRPTLKRHAGVMLRCGSG
ncbi:MAG: hypothetical protein QXS01_04800 [Candidatus Bathyarchaeia archaeon]